MPENQTPTADAKSEPPYGMFVVMTGLVSVAAVAIVAMFQYPDDATMVVTALGPVLAVIGTLVGGYFGLRGASLGQQKAADAEIKRAEIRADAATATGRL